MGEVGLLAIWFILSEGPVFGLLVNKLSRSILMFPEFFQVDPTKIGLLFTGCFSVLLFVAEDNGWSGAAVGVNTVSKKRKLVTIFNYNIFLLYTSMSWSS